MTKADMYDQATRSMVNVRNMLRGAQSSLEEAAELSALNGAIEPISTVSRLLERADEECVEVMRRQYRQFYTKDRER